MSTHSDCMSKKIKKLLDEGYPKDQAIAISYRYCGGSKYEKAAECEEDEEKKKKKQKNLAARMPESDLAMKQFDLSMDQLHIPHADSVEMPHKAPDCRLAHSMLADETKASGEYRMALESILDEDLKKIFEELAADEAEHAVKLSEWIKSHPKKAEAATETTEKSIKKLTVEICKVADNIVYGIVLKADQEDLQGDIMAAEDITKAAHDYLAEYRAINIDHDRDIDACPVESWVAKENGILGGREYGPGDWLMGTRIDDPVILKGVRDGIYKSYSIEGEGIREQLV